MKNSITYSIGLFALAIVVSCATDDATGPNAEAYINIPDAHFETMLIEQGFDSDGVVNQKILKEDAEKVIQLDINFSGAIGEIEDLAGIEGFVNLKFLSAASQNLTAIDLSQNVLLDTLSLSGNSIAAIDLSNNTNLIYLDLQANEFTSAGDIYGLSEMTGLKDLDLSWNYLEEFSIHNKTLEVLHISHNDLVSLNTTGAINLQHVFIPSNKLQVVDFTTNILLETLLISGNLLQTIDLEQNANLTHLYISSNLLNRLDVSHNEQLFDLRVDRNSDLSCIRIFSGQEIATVMLSEYQKLNVSCE
ncbi:leucine-rich repeat domain-containing protein [Robertkochia sediminum]|uniref:hypothetical protein n=1 Tax=Robertkochia sediminum TaxID=2785326 RepID=UPI001934087E|nr:hypothetical protein [Robertkochia sediminum]MBL7472909.1 hypothetical protein [Robertkochia sediminum]